MEAVLSDSQNPKIRLTGSVPSMKKFIYPNELSIGKVGGVVRLSLTFHLWATDSSFDLVMNQYQSDPRNDATSLTKSNESSLEA